MRAIGLAALLVLAAPAAARPVVVSGFGSTADGVPATLYTLTNAHGMTVRFSDWGALITAIEVPDRAGHRANIALGFGDVATYQRRNPDYRFGAPIGRYAGRIAKARFTLDGREVRLVPNLGGNLLHSGATPGYDQRPWTVTPFDRGTESGAVLRLVSPAGDQGFPGTLTVTMTYTLDDAGAFRIDYAATTTAPTAINLTNHSYFNLAGAGAGAVDAQRIEIRADRVAEVNAEKLPTGRLLPVSGALDLRRPIAIGTGLAAPEIAGGGGYDHSFVLADAARATPAFAARASDPASGRTLEVLTTEPSIQFYTANGMAGTDRSPDGKPYVRHGGFALETQHLPDSVNHPGFASTVLRPGETFRSTTILRFGVARLGVRRRVRRQSPVRRFHRRRRLPTLWASRSIARGRTLDPRSRPHPAGERRARRA